MRILVVSDSHNIFTKSCIKKIKEYEPYDLGIHLGDNIKDIKSLKSHLNIELVYVKGNCDFSREDEEKIIELEGKKILITHGHKYNIKRTLTYLQQSSINKDVDVVLFGHTHVPFKQIIDGILYFNPGSVTLPRSKYGTSFGIIEITDKKVDSTIIQF